jgi:hypothetical protein
VNKTKREKKKSKTVRGRFFCLGKDNYTKHHSDPFPQFLEAARIFENGNQRL